MTNYILPALPIATDLETKKVLKKGIAANKALAKLNGFLKLFPMNRSF